MHFPGTDRARVCLRRFRSSTSRTAVVLLYHRVASPEYDPLGLAVSPQNFAGHMEVLARRAHVYPLTELVARLHSGVLPRAAVAVTFDDATLDNLEQGLPALERYGIPATVFVPTGFVGTQRHFWWDELCRLILSSQSLPPKLELNGGSRSCVVDVMPSSPPPPAWIHGNPSNHPRHHAYSAMHRFLKDLPAIEQEEALANLILAIGPEAPALDPLSRVMSATELGALIRSGLVHLGAHTVNHVRLSALPAEAQANEICESRRTLENLIDSPVLLFAYPYGAKDDFDQSSRQCLASAGFSAAVTTRSASWNRGEDPWELPRHHVVNMNARDFERRLEAWLLQ